MHFRITRRGAGRAGLFVVLLMLVVGASMAYRYLFNRPGEQAIQLIPADALAVITLDTTPSPSQAPIFNRIRKALEEQGVAHKVESAVTDAVRKSPVVSQVRPYTRSSFALTILSQPDKKSTFDSDPVVLISISDPAKVQETLEKNGAKQTADGLSLYRFAADKTYAAVIANYLVVSGKPADIARIEAVRQGRTAPVSSLREYQDARAALPEDANLMVFLSPTAMKEIGDESKKTGGVDPLKSSQWMAMSATLRDAGVAIDYRMPMDPAKSPGLQRTATIAPLDMGTLKKLPSGAYGVIALSQPDHYWDSIHQTVQEDPKQAKSFDDGIAEFEKQTGMSVQKDILPGLQGHVWLAVYPDARGADRGVDGLVLIDDANGADPAALAEKVRGYVQKASSENGKQGIAFQSREKDGAIIWDLDEQTTGKMREGMAEATSSGGQMLGGGQSMRPDVRMTGAGIEAPGASVKLGEESVHVQAPGVSVNVDPSHVDVQAPGASVHVNGQEVNIGAPGVHVGASADPTASFPRNAGALQQPQVSPGAKRFADNKTVVHAQVGKAVLIASSQEMLDRALSVYQGQGNSLADDAPYANMRNALPPGAQSAMMVDVPAIMRMLKPWIEKAMGNGPANGSGLTADDIVNLFGQSAGLVAGGKYDGKTAIGALFLPVDYERAIKGIGSLIRSSEDKPAQSKITWLRYAPAAAGALSGAPVRYAMR